MTENTGLGSAREAAKALRTLVDNAMTGGATEHQLLINELSRVSKEHLTFLRQLRRCLREAALADGVHIELWSSAENLGPTANTNRIQLVGSSRELLISASSQYVWRNAIGQVETSLGFVLALPSSCSDKFDELFLLTEKLFQERASLTSNHVNREQAA